MSDQFLSQSTCSRCPKDLSVRIMSWFNNDTICMKCSAKETEIKDKLRHMGIKDAMEGCGYIPKIDECDHCNGYGSSLKDPEGTNTCSKCGGKGLVTQND